MQQKVEKKKRKSTKERLMLEALKLFAQKGYESVTVAEIASAVDVSAPAIYKHFSSKRKLFDAILELSDIGYAEQMSKLNVNFSSDSEVVDAYMGMTEEQQIEIAINLFEHTLHDQYPALLRKLMIIEQFNMPELAIKYNERYVFSKFDFYTKVFEAMMKAGMIEQTDAKTLAVMYISPITLMISVCDRCPDMEEEAKKIIINSIKEFNRTYIKR